MSEDKNLPSGLNIDVLTKKIDSKELRATMSTALGVYMGPNDSIDAYLTKLNQMGRLGDAKTIISILSAYFKILERLIS